VGAPEAAWEDLGSRTLRAAGLAEVESVHARNTWMEILAQSLSMLARAAGEALQREVTCATGSEQAPPEGPLEWYAVTLTYPEAASRLLIGIAPRLAELIDSAGQPETPEQADAPGAQGCVAGQAGETVLPAGWSRTMGLLLDVELPVSISFGKAQLPMKDVLKLTTGSIVELNRAVSEPVEVLVNQCLIARGEVVVIEGNYGVRIQQIVSTTERIRSMR
jgi:flagellar motor switch protein FliN/FliY